MWSRYQPSYLHLPDPWRSSGLSHLQMYEDYWEDASVSLKCSDDWEVMKQGVCDDTPDLGVPPPYLPSREASRSEERSSLVEERECMECGVDGSITSDKQQLCGSMEEDCEESESEVCNVCSEFPPPLATCSTLSIKQGGRFVLKEVIARPHIFFRAERENGRLRLQLIHPILACEEDSKLDSEDELREIRSEVSDEFISLEEPSSIGVTDAIETVSEDFRIARKSGKVSCSVSSSEEIESLVRDVGSEREDALVASYDETGFVNRIVESIHIESCLGFGVQAPRQQPPSPLWVAGDASLKLWPASQVFLSQPLTRVRPVVGF